MWTPKEYRGCFRGSVGYQGCKDVRAVLGMTGTLGTQGPERGIGDIGGS